MWKSLGKNYRRQEDERERVRKEHEAMKEREPKGQEAKTERERNKEQETRKERERNELLVAGRKARALLGVGWDSSSPM